MIDTNRGPDDASLYQAEHHWPRADDRLRRPADLERRPGADEIANRCALPCALPRRARRRDRRVRAAASPSSTTATRSRRDPFLFAGRLPDFNIGTNGGATCARASKAARDICAATGRTMAVNGRFKGGWTTRHYGRPEAGVHAIQMELAQATHLAAEEPPFAYDEAKAAGLRVTLGDILRALAALAPSLARAA